MCGQDGTLNRDGDESADQRADRRGARSERAAAGRGFRAERQACAQSRDDRGVFPFSFRDRAACFDCRIAYRLRRRRFCLGSAAGVGAAWLAEKLTARSADPDLPGALRTIDIALALADFELGRNAQDCADLPRSGGGA